MSKIPTRKKTPEEIAALREKELGASIPVTPQVVATPQGAPAPKFAPPPSLSPAQQNKPLVLPTYTKKKPMRQRAELHGTPHVFDGLRPQEAAEQIWPGPEVNHTTALPSQKHSDQEIMRMRQRDLMQTRPPVAHIQSMALHPFLVAMLYAATIATPFLTSRYWHFASTARWYAPGIGGGVLLALSAIIYFTKPRARHHAAIVCGVILVTLCFCILITLKSSHAQ